MTASSSGKLRTALGTCGIAASEIFESEIQSGLEPYAAVQQAGSLWREKGYDYPRRNDMTILSLQFQVPVSTGWPAGAPWFEDWKTDYQEPVENMLNHTANGFANGSHRAKGQLFLYYYVLNTEAAISGVQAIAAASKAPMPMEIHTGNQPKRPGVHFEYPIPSPLEDMYSGFQQMALTLAEASQSVVFHTVTLTPQLVHESSRLRVKGPDAKALRIGLKKRWGFECNLWPPLGGHSSEPLLCVDQLEPADEALLLDKMLRRIQQPVYLLDCEEGFFKIEPGNIFRGAYEGVIFPEDLEWIIYFSHHNTITFGGTWLKDALQSLFATRPGKLRDC